MNSAVKACNRLQAGALEALAWPGDKAAPPRTELILDWAGVTALADEWNGLLAQSRADTIYLPWEWLDAWIRAVGRKYEPFVIAVRDANGALCGLAPFYRMSYSLLGVLPFRMLRLAGDQPT